MKNEILVTNKSNQNTSMDFKASIILPFASNKIKTIVLSFLEI